MLIGVFHHRNHTDIRGITNHRANARKQAATGEAADKHKYQAGLGDKAGAQFGKLGAVNNLAIAMRQPAGKQAVTIVARVTENNDLARRNRLTEQAVTGAAIASFTGLAHSSNVYWLACRHHRQSPFVGCIPIVGLTRYAGSGSGYEAVFFAQR